MGTSDSDVGSPWDFRPDGGKVRKLIISMELPDISEQQAVTLAEALTPPCTDAEARAALVTAWGFQGGRLWDNLPAIDAACAPGRSGPFVSSRERVKTILRMLP